MNKTNKGISLIIEILLVFSIMLAVIAIFIKGTVLNEKTYTNILNKNNTYEQVTEVIYNKIDALLSAKNINYDIKESVITEDDIKTEADNMISGLVDYLKTGENNIKPLDTAIYKQRVADLLQSVLGQPIKSTNKDLSFNYDGQTETIAYKENSFKFDNMMVIQEKSEVEEGTFKTEKLMSQSEAEAKVYEILRKKGLTVDQAIEKARKKGISEEEALNILAGYGITIDEETESPSESSNDSSTGNSYNNTKNETSTNGETGSNVNGSSVDKANQSGVNIIADKLLDEAGSSIEKEVEKLNITKVLESSELQNLAKITSLIYKMFLGIIILPIILMVALVKINGNELKESFRYIGNAFLFSGLILFVISFGAQALKVYEQIDINIVYIKDVISYITNYFLRILSIYAVLTLIIGLMFRIPKMKN